MSFDSLHPHAKNALANCANGMTEEETAACTVLRGLDRFVRGERKAASGEFSRALALYGNIEDPWGIWLVRFLLGAMAREEGNLALAEFHLTTSLAFLDLLQESDKPLPARSLRLFGEIFHVPDIVLLIVDIEPENLSLSFKQYAATAAHYLLGLDFSCRRRYEKAEEHFHQALNIVIDNPSVYDEKKLRQHIDWLRLARQGPVPPTPFEDSHDLIVNWLYSSTYSEFCEVQLPSYSDYLERSLSAACSNSTSKHYQAACEALRGSRHLSREENELAKGPLDNALDIYSESEDLFGTWIAQYLLAVSARRDGDTLDARRHLLSGLNALLEFKKLNRPAPGRSLRLYAEIAGLEDMLLAVENGSPSFCVDSVCGIEHLG